MSTRDKLSAAAIMATPALFVVWSSWVLGVIALALGVALFIAAVK